MEQRSLPLRTFIQKRMSVDIAISEEIIDQVITHCFNSVYNNMLNNDSVEISGWGKFMFNRKRAEKYVIKLEQQIEMYKNEIERNDLTDRKRVIVQGKLNVLINNLELLKKKLQNEPK